jgi:hypothetical protein
MNKEFRIRRLLKALPECLKNAAIRQGAEKHIATKAFP